jgi:hypothetical protein
MRGPIGERIWILNGWTARAKAGGPILACDGASPNEKEWAIRPD